MPMGHSRSKTIAVPALCYAPLIISLTLAASLTTVSLGRAATPSSGNFAPSVSSKQVNDRSLPAAIPTMQPDSPLTLSGSVWYALQHSPQLQLAEAMRQKVSAQLIPQQPGFHPAIAANAYESFEGPTLSLPLQSGRRIVIPSQEHQASISAEQIIYHAGASANSARISAMTASADAVYQDSVGSAAHDVMSAFYTVLQARAGETLARNAVSVVARNVENVRILIVARQAVRADLLNVQTTLSEAEMEAFNATTGRIVAEANFNRVLGRPLLAPVNLNLTQQLAPLPGTVEEATRMGLAYRPDLKQRRQDLTSARAGLSLAHSESGPTVTAHAGYSIQTATALLPPDQWTVRAMVSLPLLPTAEQRSDIAQAKAGIQAAEAGLRLQEDADALLILKAWEDYQSSKLLLVSDRSAVAAQQEAVRAAGLRRQVGEVTQTDIANASLKLEQATSKLTRDEYSVSLRTVDLQYEMGLLSNRAAFAH